MPEASPVVIRLPDIPFAAGSQLRGLPAKFRARAATLYDLMPRHPPARMVHLRTSRFPIKKTTPSITTVPSITRPEVEASIG